ncbi:uncharacterized protein LOC144334973 [Macaca mulatta]
MGQPQGAEVGSESGCQRLNAVPSPPWECVGRPMPKHTRGQARRWVPRQGLHEDSWAPRAAGRSGRRSRPELGQRMLTGQEDEPMETSCSRDAEPGAMATGGTGSSLALTRAQARLRPCSRAPPLTCGPREPPAVSLLTLSGPHAPQQAPAELTQLKQHSGSTGASGEGKAAPAAHTTALPPRQGACRSHLKEALPPACLLSHLKVPSSSLSSSLFCPFQKASNTSTGLLPLLPNATSWCAASRVQWRTAGPPATREQEEQEAGSRVARGQSQSALGPSLDSGTWFSVSQPPTNPTGRFAGGGGCSRGKWCSRGKRPARAGTRPRPPHSCVISDWPITCPLLHPLTGAERPPPGAAQGLPRTRGGASAGPETRPE